MVVEKEKLIETKQDIKNIIDKSTDYKELYENSIAVLTKMENDFTKTLTKIADREHWDENMRRGIARSRFDDVLSIDNPITKFEKKGKELKDRAKSILGDNAVLNTLIQIGKYCGIGKRLGQDEKNKITNELFQTREEAIQDFKKDISDGIISNYNNIGTTDAENVGEKLGESIFWGKEKMNSEDFKKYIESLNLTQLIYGTFNIYNGSSAFEYCYNKIKEKLGNQNLLDYIDKQKNGKEDKTPEILRYSIIKMLLCRRRITDLKNLVYGYGNGDNRKKVELINYILENIKNDGTFKMYFINSIEGLEKIPIFKLLVNKVKKDPLVKKAYELSKEGSQINNVDIFNTKKINGLVCYDSFDKGGGLDYFKDDLSNYIKKGFSSKKEEFPLYEKYVLTKGSDTISMVRLKQTSYDDNQLAKIDKSIGEIIKGKNFNLFALRGHCYATEKMALALGKHKAVGKNDIFIDGGCFNSLRIPKYKNSGIEGQIFAYVGMGKGASTQSFIDRLIDEKSSGKTFFQFLQYYNGCTNEADKYFAANVDMPSSIATIYKNLLFGKK